MTQMQIGLLIGVLTFLVFLAAFTLKRLKKKQNKPIINWEDPPSGFQILQHSCGGKNLIPNKWIVGNTFSCMHCHKKVLLLEARCPNCKALVKLKKQTPLFFNPLHCRVCKKVFELHSKGGKCLE